MDREILKKNAQQITSTLMRHLGISYIVEVYDSLSADDFFGAGNRIDIYYNRYILTLKYGFSDENEAIRVDRYAPALEYLVRHELGGKLVGAPSTEGAIRTKTGNAEVSTARLVMHNRFPSSYDFTGWHRSHEIAADRVAVEMDDTDIRSSLVYASVRSFEELSKRPARNFAYKELYFLHCAKLVALFEELSFNKESQPVRDFIKRRYPWKYWRGGFDAVVDTYREVYQTTTFSLSH